jgi:MATE family multidrug resistance protein
VTWSARLHSVRRIAPLAWPVFIGQIAVLAFGTIDTVLVARHGATDLAALAIGGAAYITVFIGLMGVVLAVGPIVGQLFGARRWLDAGHQLHQAVWLALVLSVLGCALLLFPQPFLLLARATPEVAAKVRGYLGWLALALPPALVFTAFRGFNTALSRPKVVMALQLGSLVAKVPLSIALVFGVDALELPALGAPGCGLATAIAVWAQFLLALVVLRRDPFYAPFGVQTLRLSRPHPASLSKLLRLGVPMGGSILVEVTGFTFMAFFIARTGTTAVAGHQLAANLVALLYMLPMAWANATSTLVAQSIGAGDATGARRLAWHGLTSAMAVAGLLGLAVYLGRVPILHLYTDDEAVIAAAFPLLAWVALFHLADATQAVAGFVMRAYHVATAPLVIYALAIWGVGLAGGYVLAFGVVDAPPSLRGAVGFWSAATAGVGTAAIGLVLLMHWVLRVNDGTNKETK